MKPTDDIWFCEKCNMSFAGGEPCDCPQANPPISDAAQELAKLARDYMTASASSDDLDLYFAEDEYAGEIQSALDTARAEARREALEPIKEIVDLYFMPWGAAKSAMCEDLIGDVGFNANDFLRKIRNFITEQQGGKENDPKQ